MPPLGFSFDVGSTTIPDLRGATMPDGLRGKTTVRTEVVAQAQQRDDYLNLFAYFVNFPHPDYYFWSRIKRNLIAYLDDRDSMAPIPFMTLNPDLNYASTGAAATVQEYRDALFEKIKRYFQAIAFFQGCVYQCLNWANMRGFPISERLMSKLKRTTIQTLCQELNGFPICSAVDNYLLGQQRILEFQPAQGVLAHAYPIYKYERDSRMEGQVGLGSRFGLLPTFPELNCALAGTELPNAAGLATRVAALHDGDGYGMLAKYLMDRLIAARTYLLDTLGFHNLVQLKSKLRSFLEGIGVFDTEFKFETAAERVNSLPIYDGPDFVKKFMIAFDRPRPIIRWAWDPLFAVVNLEDTKIKDDPMTYIWSAGELADSVVAGSEGVLGVDNFEAIYWSDWTASEADGLAILDTQTWMAPNGTVVDAKILNTIKRLAGDLVYTDHSRVCGGAMIHHLLAGWYKPGWNFYLPDDEFLVKENGTPEVTGLPFIVGEEYNKGLFMPRYTIWPTIDNTDIFMCGFYYVLQTENASAYPWDAWAASYVYDEAGDATTLNAWGDSRGTLKDCLLYVGAGMFETPLQAARHPLAAQASIYDDDADFNKNADLSLGFQPFRPFTYHYWRMSVPFTAANWDDAVQGFDAAADQDVYAHSLTISMGEDRCELWMALDFPDELRPWKVRHANWVGAMTYLYKEVMQDVENDLGSIFVNEPVNTVELRPDNKRLISRFKIASLEKGGITVNKAGIDRRTNPATKSKAPKGGASIKPESVDDVRKSKTVDMEAAKEKKVESAFNQLTKLEKDPTKWGPAAVAFVQLVGDLATANFAGGKDILKSLKSGDLTMLENFLANMGTRWATGWAKYIIRIKSIASGRDIDWFAK
jgi:hypothetical protein